VGEEGEKLSLSREVSPSGGRGKELVAEKSPSLGGGEECDHLHLGKYADRDLRSGGKRVLNCGGGKRTAKRTLLSEGGGGGGVGVWRRGGKKKSSLSKERKRK